MNGRATAQAMQVPAEVASGSVRLVMLVLAFHVSMRSGLLCSLPVWDIAQQAGVSHRSAQRALRVLEGLGVITITHSRGAPSTYYWQPNTVQNMIYRSRR